MKRTKKFIDPEVRDQASRLLWATISEFILGFVVFVLSLAVWSDFALLFIDSIIDLTFARLISVMLFLGSVYILISSVKNFHNINIDAEKIVEAKRQQRLLESRK